MQRQRGQGQAKGDTTDKVNGEEGDEHTVRGQTEGGRSRSRAGMGEKPVTITRACSSLDPGKVHFSSCWSEDNNLLLLPVTPLLQIVKVCSMDQKCPLD